MNILYHSATGAHACTKGSKLNNNIGNPVSIKGNTLQTRAYRPLLLLLLLLLLLSVWAAPWLGT